MDLKGKSRDVRERHLKCLKRSTALMEHMMNNPPYSLPPLPGEEDIREASYSYGNLPSDLCLKIRQMPPEYQQRILHHTLKSTVETYKAEIRRVEANLNEDSIDDIILEISSDTSTVMNLPNRITRAAESNQVGKVLDWLGPAPISKDRINATNYAKMGRTILHEAQFEGHLGLMSIILQYGADVNSKSTFGSTPLSQACCYVRLHEAALLLLQWGAEKFIDHDCVEQAKNCGNSKLVKLLESPLGGRRCKIVGLKARDDLNGMTCVAKKYIPVGDRYIVQMDEEQCQEVAKVKSTNLIRFDRTPEDYGLHYFYMGEDSTGESMIGMRYLNYAVPITGSAEINLEESPP